MTHMDPLIIVVTVVAVGTILGSPLEKRQGIALDVGTRDLVGSQKHDRLQSYLDFFYKAAKIAGFTEDVILDDPARQKGCIDQSCKDGWVSYKGHCYLFVDTVKLNWTDAESSCESEKSRLVVIETAEENAFLTDFITRLFKNRGSLRMGFWTAGLEVGGEGLWRWYPDNSVLQYSDFQPGHISGSTNENCLILWGHFDFKWADHFCYEDNYFVCEK